MVEIHEVLAVDIGLVVEALGAAILTAGFLALQDSVIGKDYTRASSSSS